MEHVSFHGIYYIGDHKPYLTLSAQTDQDRDNRIN